MKTSHGAALFVAGLLAGFGAAFALRGPGTGVAGEAQTLRGERDAANTRAERAEADLAAAREGKRRPRAAADLPAGAIAADTRAAFDDPTTPKPAAANAATPAALSPEARTKRRDDLVREMHLWFENHEGEKAVAALKELAGLGPDARDAAMKLAVDINKDVQGAGELRLSMFTFYTGLGEPAVRDLMMWSLDNQASSAPDFRVISAYSVPWVMKPDEAIARFDVALAHETDRSVQSAIVGNLSSMNSAKAESVLAKVFGDTTRDIALRADAAMALATSNDPAIAHAIEAAAQGDAEPRIQSAAKLSLVLRNPPATGCLVTRTSPDGNAEAAGIKSGDVIVSYNGRPVATNEELVRERDASASSAADSVAVLIVRDGREQTVQVKSGRLGLPDLRPVKKK